jgi:hypothetical protein
VKRVLVMIFSKVGSCAVDANSPLRRREIAELFLT